MQSAYSIFNAFGALAGDKTIVSGCEIQGVNVTDGYIFYNNELLFFKGGIKQNTIVIIEQKQEVEFEDKTLKDVYKTRYATFGVSGNSIPWGDFKRYYINQPMYKEIKWVGASVTQEDLPKGWFIADGQNGTDNILGRGIMGYDAAQDEFNAVGKKGGAAAATITKENLPVVNSDVYVGKRGTAHASGEWWSVTLGSEFSLPAGTKRLSTSDFGAKGEKLKILQPYVVAKAIQFIG